MSLGIERSAYDFLSKIGPPNACPVTTTHDRIRMYGVGPMRLERHKRGLQVSSGVFRGAGAPALKTSYTCSSEVFRGLPVVIIALTLSKQHRPGSSGVFRGHPGGVPVAHAVIA